MQHPENAFHAFLGIQQGENMVFLLFERKDVKNAVSALAIFRRGAENEKSSPGRRGGAGEWRSRASSIVLGKLLMSNTRTA
ncbi:hypothetical protein, partial [Salmonella enterica]|uniref:hypothetical protein n=1 Tax=Salmonella enterica TaxID=28901 RepID=UPI00398C3782